MTTQLSLPGFEPRPQPQVFHRLVMTFPPPAVAQGITRLAHEFRTASELTGRLRPTHHLHVSLHSLGQTTSVPSCLLQPTPTMELEFAFPPFAVTFNRVSRYSHTNRPSPLVLLPDTESCAALYDLYLAIGAALREVSAGAFRFDDKFSPHLTLLYDGKKITEHSIAPVRWIVSEFRQVISVVGQTRYLHLTRWSLTG